MCLAGHQRVTSGFVPAYLRYRRRNGLHGFLAVGLLDAYNLRATPTSLHKTHKVHSDKLATNPIASTLYINN